MDMERQVVDAACEIASPVRSGKIQFHHMLTFRYDNVNASGTDFLVPGIAKDRLSVAFHHEGHFRTSSLRSVSIDLIQEPVEVEARLLSLRHLDIEFDITVVFFIYLRRHVTVLLFIPEEAK